MKKFISICLCCFLLLTTIGVFAVEDDEMFVITQKPITVTYNGDSVLFPDAQPIIQNGKTLVPARAIMERAKLAVDFDAETRTVTAAKDDFSISMTIDNNIATVTAGEVSRNITLEEPARIIDDRTYVPIRFIGESMKVKVNWNANYREVVLIDTNEWKQEIAESSELLTMLLDMPAKPDQGTAGNFSGDISLGYEYKNLPADSGLPADTYLHFDFNVTGTDVFDGKNSGAFAMVQMDLSSIYNLVTYMTGEEPAELAPLAEKMMIDLDMIVDSEWNLYLKSGALLELLKTSEEGAELAKVIGDRYIKIPLSDLTGFTFPDANSYETYWEAFEAMIEADDLMYSRSVAELDQKIALYAKIFHNDLLTKTTRYDGSENWKLTLDAKNFTNIALEMLCLDAERSGTPLSEAEIAEHKEYIGNIAFQMTIKATVKDENLTKSEVLLTFDTGDVTTEEQAADGEKAPTLRTTGTINLGSSTRKFNSYQDKKVSIPKKVITLEELLGFSYADYQALNS
ncbi:MAG: copper amine oxidase N-terminal domain-containing protein [Clostridia bacterium]|nr:copper amine oxidase N-terminal domain-containing protein [Clostridia bacterium]